MRAKIWQQNHWALFIIEYKNSEIYLLLEEWSNLRKKKEIAK